MLIRLLYKVWVFVAELKFKPLPICSDWLKFQNRRKQFDWLGYSLDGPELGFSVNREKTRWPPLPFLTFDPMGNRIKALFKKLTLKVDISWGSEIGDDKTWFLTLEIVAVSQKQHMIEPKLYIKKK